MKSNKVVRHMLVRVPPRAIDARTPATQWRTIGYATQMEDGVVLGTITVVPIGWDGTFYLYDSDKTKKEASD